MMLKNCLIHQIRVKMMKDDVQDVWMRQEKLSKKILTKFVALRPKTYSYVTDDDKNVKKGKGTKTCVIKRILKFDDYKEWNHTKIKTMI